MRYNSIAFLLEHQGSVSVQDVKVICYYVRSILKPAKVVSHLTLVPCRARIRSHWVSIEQIVCPLGRIEYYALGDESDLLTLLLAADGGVKPLFWSFGGVERRAATGDADLPLGFIGRRGDGLRVRRRGGLRERRSLDLLAGGLLTLSGEREGVRRPGLLLRLLPS